MSFGPSFSSSATRRSWSFHPLLLLQGLCRLFCMPEAILASAFQFPRRNFVEIRKWLCSLLNFLEVVAHNVAHVNGILDFKHFYKRKGAEDYFHGKKWRKRHFFLKKKSRNRHIYICINQIHTVVCYDHSMEKSLFLYSAGEPGSNSLEGNKCSRYRLDLLHEGNRVFITTIRKTKHNNINNHSVAKTQ